MDHSINYKKYKIRKYQKIKFELERRILELEDEIEALQSTKAQQHAEGVVEPNSEVFVN